MNSETFLNIAIGVYLLGAAITFILLVREHAKTGIETRNPPNFLMMAIAIWWLFAWWEISDRWQEWRAGPVGDVDE